MKLNELKEKAVLQIEFFIDEIFIRVLSSVGEAIKGALYPNHPDSFKSLCSKWFDQIEVAVSKFFMIAYRCFRPKTFLRICKQIVREEEQAAIREQHRDLASRQRAAAELAFEDWQVEGLIDCNGWLWDYNRASRVVFLENLEDPNGPSIKGTFGVEFAPDSAEIIDQWNQ